MLGVGLAAGIGLVVGWITYQRKNPMSGKIEKKLAYWERKDDLIFKAGTYEAS